MARSFAAVSLVAVSRNSALQMGVMPSALMSRSSCALAREAQYPVRVRENLISLALGASEDEHQDLRRSPR
jgi:hypothetical protein